MVVVTLAGSTRSTDRVDPLTSPDAQWCKTITNLSLPGRFAFFVFKVQCDWDIADHLHGLEWSRSDSSDADDYILAGSFDKLNSACYALLNNDSPHDIQELFRYIYTKLSDFGYNLTGTKISTPQGFILT